MYVKLYTNDYNVNISSIIFLLKGLKMKTPQLRDVLLNNAHQIIIG